MSCVVHIIKSLYFSPQFPQFVDVKELHKLVE